MTKIVRIPLGETRGLEEIQLKREVQRDYKVMDSLTDSFETVKIHPKETIVSLLLVGTGYFIIYFVVYLAAFAAGMAGFALSEVLKDVNEILAQVVLFGIIGIGYILVMVAAVLAQAVAIGAYTICILKVVRGQELNMVEDIQSVKPFIKPLVVTSILYTIAVMVGMLGFMVGAYVVMFGCMFAQFLVVDKNITGIDALKASWRISDGHKLNFLGFFFVAQCLNMLGMLACGVGMFFTMPMTMVALLTIYDALVEPGNAYNSEEVSVNVFV